MRKDECVVDEGTAEDGASFEVLGCVEMGEGEEGMDQSGRQEEGAQGVTGFGCGRWGESVSLGLRG